MGVGKYEKPKVEVEEKRAQETTPAKVLFDGVKEELEQDVKALSEQAAQAKNYEEILANAKIPIEKAHDIVDSLLSQGYYTETLPITKRLSVTFRTRTHGDYVRFLRALEQYNPRFMDEQTEIQMRYYLAASLVAFKGYEFEHPAGEQGSHDVTKAFAERLSWVEKQPEQVIALLVGKLHSFDQCVQIVMSEGVVENF